MPPEGGEGGGQVHQRAGWERAGMEGEEKKEKEKVKEKKEDSRQEGKE